MSAPEMRSPAPLAGENRAKSVKTPDFSSIARPETEGDFAAVYLARRFHLSPCMARTVAALASLGRAFQ
jgi:hypothetical protein